MKRLVSVIGVDLLMMLMSINFLMVVYEQHNYCSESEKQ
jgi:hypothetical protein